jgi:hypothetical protein
LHVSPIVLGTLVLLAFLAAIGAVAVIAFVLFGPVPVNRKVVIVSRILPVPMPRAALPIQLQAPIEVVFAPPAAPPPTPRRANVDAPIAPLVLRRPRGDTPPPRPPQRMARGTQGRPRQDFDSVEVTAPQTPSFDVEEMTHLDRTNLH